ncbi:glycosyltransferase family 39 protein [Candidatus Daviesbacteria bacterium]|nr:glycosyltransferase family 39 protein [Candidatus Daviesbacteria bacterium]
MINILAKYKYPLILGMLLTLAFGATRLANLTILPVFVDEAIYIRWSQVMRDPAWRFIPLTDGKQPLFMWLSSPLVNLWSDPLFASRLISVIAGFFGMIGIFLLSRELFSKKIGSIAAFFYVLVPFFVFYDRLAVPDGLLTVLGIWAMFLSVVLARTVRLDVALILGMVIGAATLTKSPGFFYLLLVPSGILVFNFSRQALPKLVKLALLWILVALMALVIYNILRLSPYFYLIGQRTYDFILTPAEFLQNGPFWWLLCRGASFTWGCGRIFESFDWLVSYFTWPIFAAAFAGMLFLFRKNWRVALFITAWSTCPLLVENAIAKGFTARYIIFATFPFLVTAAYFADLAIAKLKQIHYLAPWGLLVLLMPAVVFDWYLLTNPSQAAIPAKEREGYVEEWSAGYGIVEIAQFLKGKATDQRPILVGTEGTFGTLPDGLQIYVRDIPNLTVVGMGQNADIYNIPKDLVDFANRGNLAYLVVNKTRLHPANDPHLKLIASYPKPAGRSKQEELLFFQIIKLK